MVVNLTLGKVKELFATWKGPSKYPSLSSARSKRIDRFNFSPELARKVERAKRCFIVGLGPSISKINSNAFLDTDLVIGVNKVLRTHFCPDIVCVSDPSRLDLTNSHKLSKLITVKHLEVERRADLATLDQAKIYSDIEVHFPLTKTWDHVDSFDKRFKKIFWGGAVITDLAIPLAVYLGIKEIHVIGMDDIRRSWPMTHATGREEANEPPDSALVFHLHERVAKLAALAGATVNNASLGGFLFAFPRSSLPNLIPNSISRSFNGECDGKYIVVGNRIAKLIRHSLSDNVYHIRDGAGDFLSHASGKVGFRSVELSQEKEFILEPSFVNANWISLRIKSRDYRYVTSYGRPSDYRVRHINSAFSPYFSSFPVFEDEAEAKRRAKLHDRLVGADRNLAEIANAMAAEDQSMLNRK
ncbi:6-hydroxymethylpterin diphosphokinase MptE-like protein [Agrobacterium sp. ES01]|uniref:6-hydroxymethylpterin diphosphokinase MptE-like protein n=1 Tax=Agrobacterium sp. ES01 TaxID=3420714 RepID=UPI003D150E8F